MSLSPRCNCDPEEVFALADGGLSPRQEREVRDHLGACPECQALHEKELRLSSKLESLDFSGVCSVRERVVMSLPTRPLKVRLFWTLLSAMLLSLGLFALISNGVNPMTFVVGGMEAFWSTSGMVTDLFDTTLSVAGGTILIALAVGAVLDLLLAAILLSVSRRRTNRTREI